MQLLDTLPQEHRLIARWIRLLAQELSRLRGNIAVSPEFAFVEPRLLQAAVRFLQDFAQAGHQDREDLLRAALGATSLDPEQQRLRQRLARQHEQLRAATRGLAAATESYLQGREEAVADILASLETLVNLYPQHLAAAEAFFPGVMDDLSPAPRQAMAAGGQTTAAVPDADAWEQLITAWEARGCKCHLE